MRDTRVCLVIPGLCYHKTWGAADPTVDFGGKKDIGID